MIPLYAKIQIKSDSSQYYWYHTMSGIAYVNMAVRKFDFYARLSDIFTIHYMTRSKRAIYFFFLLYVHKCKGIWYPAIYRNISFHITTNFYFRDIKAGWYVFSITLLADSILKYVYWNIKSHLLENG